MRFVDFLSYFKLNFSFRLKALTQGANIIW